MIFKIALYCFLGLAVVVGGMIWRINTALPYPEVPPFFRNLPVSDNPNLLRCASPPDQADLLRSSGLTERLDAVFPTGSDAKISRDFVVSQGFMIQPPCRDDPAVQSAYFGQSPAFLKTMFNGTVFWKADGNGRIVWTKGFVIYRTY